MDEYTAKVRRLCRDRLARYEPDHKIVETSDGHYCIIPKEANPKTYDYTQAYVFTTETLLNYTEELKLKAKDCQNGQTIN